MQGAAARVLFYCVINALASAFLLLLMNQLLSGWRVIFYICCIFQIRKFLSAGEPLGKPA